MNHTLEPIPQAVQLDIPWRGQNLPEVLSDDFSNSDCGATCLAMWLGYRNVTVTIDEVSQATGLPRHYTGARPDHLIQAASFFHLPLKRQFALGAGAIRHELAAGRPVILLVHYRTLPKRFDPNFRSGHWILATGYTPLNCLYHDPYGRGEGWANVPIDWVDLLRAQLDCNLDGNIVQQGLLEVV